MTGDSGSQGGDAGQVDDAGNPVGPFGLVQPLASLNSPNDDMSPTLTADLLEICFVSNRGGPFAVYCSVRSSASGPWPAPTLSEVSANGGDEDSVGLSADGLTMYLGHTPVLSDEPSIAVATRVTRGDTWSQPVLINELSMPAVLELDPQPSPDHLELWYVSDDPSFGDVQLYRASRATPTGPWSAGSLVSELADIGGPNTSPALSGNGDVVYFVKTLVSLVDADIYRATRISPTMFGTPEAVTELNTGGVESGVWISPDQLTVAFAGNENAHYDLYLATR